MSYGAKMAGVYAEKVKNREVLIRELAKRYFDFLKSNLYLCEDSIYEHALAEGKNKFLSNAYIYLHGKEKHCTDFYSREVYEAFSQCNSIEDIKQYVIKKHNLQRNEKITLIHEHIVPKEKYIQKECEKIVKQGLTQKMPDAEMLGMITDILLKRFYVATIFNFEDQQLFARDDMPGNWEDINNIFARYQQVKLGEKIELASMEACGNFTKRWKDIEKAYQ